MSSEYYAFLLRLQRDGEKRRWRIVVINVETREEHRFIGKRALLTFLYSILNRSRSDVADKSSYLSK